MVFCLFLRQKYEEIANCAINVHNMYLSIKNVRNGHSTRFLATVSKTEIVVVLSIWENTHYEREN